jgi:hypothetical protein
MTDDERAAPIQLLENHEEGMLLYSDALRRGVRIEGIITLFTYYDPTTGMLQSGHSVQGNFPSAVTALAAAYVVNPALKLAVDGMYEFFRHLPAGAHAAGMPLPKP